VTFLLRELSTARSFFEGDSQIVRGHTSFASARFHNFLMTALFSLASFIVLLEERRLSAELIQQFL
jgi:hypothetical protein